MTSILVTLANRNPDIRDLERKGEVKRLARLLSHGDFNIQWQAAEALGRMGEPASRELIRRTYDLNRDVRIGAVEVLGEMREKQALPKLITLLRDDKSSEVRFASAVALGEIGDPTAIPELVNALRDPDKYVRYGVALSLDGLDWNPGSLEETAFYLVAYQKWEDIETHANLPAAPFIHHLKDQDPDIRARSAEVLGRLRTPQASEACSTVLRDINGEVRWTGILAFPECGIPLMHLPRELSRRRRQRKDPYAAMLLNFLFLGLGYNYLGFWWGFLLFQVNVTAIVILSLMMGGPLIPYLISYVISAVFVVHTWFYVRGLPDI
ncbi:MAG: HEAT repeat domain-containing protein [Methanoregulaceae archaeon]|nr:HEAT repeat domain-containing protein [Methanoregulaceae archaeon]